MANSVTQVRLRSLMSVSYGDGPAGSVSLGGLSNGDEQRQETDYS